MLRIPYLDEASAGPVLHSTFLAHRGTSTSGTYTAPVTGIYWFFLFGRGGDGYDSPGTTAAGAGGGGACYKKVRLIAGQTITFSVGHADNPINTTATLPDGTVLLASKGEDGKPGYQSPGAGGAASGGDINRTGGKGGGWFNPNGDANTLGSGGAQVVPESPTNGGVRGDSNAYAAGGYGTTAGGGAAGFADLLAGFPKGDGGYGGSAGSNGYTGNVLQRTGKFPGGGGGSTRDSQNNQGKGGDAALLIYAFKE